MKCPADGGLAFCRAEMHGVVSRRERVLGLPWHLQLATGAVRDHFVGRSIHRIGSRPDGFFRPLPGHAGGPPPCPPPPPAAAPLAGTARQGALPQNAVENARVTLFTSDLAFFREARSNV